MGDRTSARVVVEYAVPAGFEFPPGFTTERFAGLLHCQILHRDGDAQSTLVTYWANTDSFDAARGVLPSVVPALATPRRAHLGDARWPRQPWWQPTSAGDLLLKAAAIVGALTVVWTALLFLFAAPDVVVRANLPIDVLADDLLRVDGVIVNNSGTAADAEIVSAALRRRWPSELERRMDVPVRANPDLKAGDSRPVQLTARPAEPGRYDVEATLTTTAGVLRRSRSRSIMLGTVEVWPRTPGRRVDPSRTEVSGGVCIVKGQLFLGTAHERGLECQTSADLSKQPKIKLRSVTSETVTIDPGEAMYNLKQDHESASMQWTVAGPLRAFTKPDVNVHLSSEEGDIPLPACQLLASRTDWSCEVVRK